MGLNDVNITLGQGGLNRALPTEDHVSAVLVSQAAPSSFGTEKVRSYRSLAQVEGDGILASDPNFGLSHYTAKEFFRMHEQGELYLGFNITSPSELLTLSDGRIRQIGAYGDLQDISTYQSFLEGLMALNAPAIFVLAPLSIADVTDTSEMVDLHNSNANLVSVLIAGDAGAEGDALATSLGLNCIPNLGALLGAISSAQVHVSPAWVEQFNFTDGVEMNKIKLADGTLLSQMLSTDLEVLNDRGYLFFRRFVGNNGVYLNDSFTATDLAGDYAYIESNRTIQKATRLLYGAYLPKLNSPLLVDPDTGQLSIDTIKHFETLGDKVLREQMESQGELSGFNVSINPEQDVLASSTLQIDVRLVPVGVARNIDISLGFAVSV